MGNRDETYMLQGQLEMDEAFFETVNLDNDHGERKRGRGSQKQTKVLVMAESQPVPVKKQKKHRKNRKCGYFKMRVIEDLRSETINKEVTNGVHPWSNVITDAYQSYSKLKKVVAVHHAVKCPPEMAHKLLPWVHTAVANAKRVLLNSYHRINTDYLQNYLDEFCYRLNRRYFDNIFERLLFAAAGRAWYI